MDDDVIIVDPPIDEGPVQDSLSDNQQQPASTTQSSSSSSLTLCQSQATSTQMPTQSAQASTQPTLQPTQPAQSSFESTQTALAPTHTSQSSGTNELDEILATFVGTLSVRQVTSIFKFSGCDAEQCTTCLLLGPTLESILDMINKRFEQYPALKVTVDFEDMWADVVSHYKNPSMNLFSRLRIILRGKPPIDSGGVRRQIYTSTFENFSNNETIRLFEGPVNHLRPACTAEARSSGLFKVLGNIIGHSICQDGIGFPFFSPTCYWYLIGGEEKALEFASVEDLPADSAIVLAKVGDTMQYNHPYSLIDVDNTSLGA